MASHSLALALTVKARALEALGEDPMAVYRRLVELLKPRREGRSVVEVAALYAEALEGIGRAEEATAMREELAGTGMSLAWLSSEAPEPPTPRRSPAS